ncbi:MAG: bile acid:sodium symporter [Deltaproteobacteria bacterium]|nr:bile acid:sodium symporter [Deltaproteobacteria bacterium]
MPSRSLVARLWLPTAILTAAGFGLWVPAAGDWLSAHRAPTVLVPVIMLLISLRVPGSQLLDAVRHPLALLGSLALIYGAFPLVALGWQALLGPAGPDPRTALIILAAQPSTLATATVLTHLAGGNAGLAVVCTAASQILSVVATPWILELYVGHAVPVDAWGLAWDLVRSVLLPVIAGQLLRVPLRRWIERRSWALSLAAESMVVLFVLMGFSTAREVLLREPFVALTVVGTVVAIHATMLVLSTGAGYLLRLDGAGRIAMTLASSQKTVAAGVLVWQSGFAANVLGPIFVVLNHLIQTVFDALLAPFMSRIRIGKRRLFPLTS